MGEQNPAYSHRTAEAIPKRDRLRLCSDQFTHLTSDAWDASHATSKGVGSDGAGRGDRSGERTRPRVRFPASRPENPCSARRRTPHGGTRMLPRRLSAAPCLLKTRKFFMRTALETGRVMNKRRGKPEFFLKQFCELLHSKDFRRIVPGIEEIHVEFLCDCE